MTKAKKSSKVKKSGVRGRQNEFSGAKLEFLDSFKDMYLTSKDPGNFYTTTSQDFIKRFGYDLKFGENPAETVDVSTLAPKEVDSTLPEEDQAAEHKRRSDFNDTLRAKLGNWYRHRFRPKTATGDIIRQLIDGLSSSGSIQAPRRKRPLDVYYALVWEPRLKDQFTEYWEGVKASGMSGEIVAARNQFVKKCYEAESAEVRADIERQAEKEHAVATQEWEEGSMVTATAEGYKKALRVAAGVLPALSNALGEWLGASVMISTVYPEEGRIEMSSVQSTIKLAQVSTLLPQYDPDGWTSYCSMFKAYGKAYFPPSDCRIRDLGADDGIAQQPGWGTSGDEESLDLGGNGGAGRIDGRVDGDSKSGDSAEQARAPVPTLRNINEAPILQSQDSSQPPPATTPVPPLIPSQPTVTPVTESFLDALNGPLSHGLSPDGNVSGLYISSGTSIDHGWHADNLCRNFPHLSTAWASGASIEGGTFLGAQDPSQMNIDSFALPIYRFEDGNFGSSNIPANTFYPATSHAPFTATPALSTSEPHFPTAASSTPAEALLIRSLPTTNMVSSELSTFQGHQPSPGSTHLSAPVTTPDVSTASQASREPSPSSSLTPLQPVSSQPAAPQHGSSQRPISSGKENIPPGDSAPGAKKIHPRKRKVIDTADSTSSPPPDPKRHHANGSTSSSRPGTRSVQGAKARGHASRPVSTPRSGNSARGKRLNSKKHTYEYVSRGNTPESIFDKPLAC